MPSILFEIKNNIAFITFNRPEKLNAFDREMAISFQTKLDEANAVSSVRCIYITGFGKAFCAGQDLEEITATDGIGMDRILAEHYNPMIIKIRHSDKPVLAAVNGVAAGAGANIALCCDIVVANESASFIQAFSRIGLIPDSGGTYFLPRLVGFQKASALMMLGDKISANEAERTGMIYKVFADHTFDTESQKIALVLAARPTKALGMIKEALNSSLSATLEQQLSTEDILQQKAANTLDFREGVKAFQQKRAPFFKGE